MGISFKIADSLNFCNNRDPSVGSWQNKRYNAVTKLRMRIDMKQEEVRKGTGQRQRQIQTKTETNTDKDKYNTNRDKYKRQTRSHSFVGPRSAAASG